MKLPRRAFLQLTAGAAAVRGQSVGLYPMAAKTLITSMLAGGGSGIRTHDTVARIHAFQACAFSHSAIPPARACH